MAIKAKISGHEDSDNIHKGSTYLTKNKWITIVHINNNVTFLNNNVDIKGNNHNVLFISCFSDNICIMKEVYGNYEDGNVSLLDIQKHNTVSDT